VTRQERRRAVLILRQLELDLLALEAADGALVKVRQALALLEP